MLPQVRGQRRPWEEPVDLWPQMMQLLRLWKATRLWGVTVIRKISDEPLYMRKHLRRVA